MQKNWNILGLKKQVLLNLSDGKSLIMKAITKDEEKEIDDAFELFGENRYKANTGRTICGTDIFMYGEINLDSPSDIELIKSKKIVTNNIMEAAIVYSGFNYKDGVIYPNEEGLYKWYNTWDRVLWFKYNHCLLGKPERIIIYKDTIITKYKN